MAANVLRSPQAVRMSVFVVRAFIQMRDLLSSNSRELAGELRALEAKLTSRLDEHELMIIDVLRRVMDLIDPPPCRPLRKNPWASTRPSSAPGADLRSSSRSLLRKDQAVRRESFCTGRTGAHRDGFPVPP